MKCLYKGESDTPSVTHIHESSLKWHLIIFWKSLHCYTKQVKITVTNKNSYTVYKGNLLKQNVSHLFSLLIADTRKVFSFHWLS